MHRIDPALIGAGYSAGGAGMFIGWLSNGGWLQVLSAIGIIATIALQLADHYRKKKWYEQNTPDAQEPPDD